MSFMENNQFDEENDKYLLKLIATPFLMHSHLNKEFEFNRFPIEMLVLFAK